MKIDTRRRDEVVRPVTLGKGRSYRPQINEEMLEQFRIECYERKLVA
jgi:hypothetical protein